MQPNFTGTDGHPPFRPPEEGGFLGDYELLHPAGRGAFGTVWVARDRSGLLRALKVIEASEGSSALREESALALVRSRVPRHPHLIEVFHVGRARGRLLYAMELADPAPGSPPADQPGYRADCLESRLKDHGPLHPAQALALVLDFLEALHALHGAGIVHRDIKPGNILFVQGKVKLADIGLASAIRSSLSLAGTPGYVPLDGSTGPDADLYALGKVLYRMVTGLEPADFPTLPARLMNSSHRQEVRRLNEFLLRACAPDRARRFTDVAAFRSALTEGNQGYRIPGSRFFWVVVAGALLLGTGLWLLSLFLFRGTENPAPPDASRKAERDAAAPLPLLPAVPIDDPHAIYLRLRDNTQRLNPGYSGVVYCDIVGGRILAADFDTAGLIRIPPLDHLTDLETLELRPRRPGAASSFDDLRPLAGAKLRKLSAAGNRIRDLAPLRGMPLEELDLGDNPVEDPAVLEHLPLRRLNLRGSSITSLVPLKGMATLLHLDIRDLPARDLSPLRDLRLKCLLLSGTPVETLEPLRGQPLETIELDLRPGDREVLRSLPRLRLINGRPAQEVLSGKTGNSIKPL